LRWNRQKKIFFKKVFFSIDRLSALFSGAEEVLRAPFENKGVKDQLFKIFWGEGKRVGKFFYIPIFSLEDPDKQDFCGEAVIAWDIRTSRVSFKVYKFVEHSSGATTSMLNNFLKKERITSLKEDILASPAKSDEEQKEIIDEYNVPYARFLERFSTSDMLGEKIFVRLAEKHYALFTRDKVRNMFFSKRNSNRVIYEKETGMPHNVTQENDPSREALENLNEYLLGEGYPDNQKIKLDFTDYSPEYFEGHASEEPTYKTKTVGYVRQSLGSWNDMTGYLEGDEAVYRTQHSIMND